VVLYNINRAELIVRRTWEGGFGWVLNTRCLRGLKIGMVAMIIVTSLCMADSRLFVHYGIRTNGGKNAAVSSLSGGKPCAERIIWNMDY